MRRRPGLGIEITSASIKAAAVVPGRPGEAVSVCSRDLPAGLVAEDFSSSSISDRNALSGEIRLCLDALGSGPFRRAGLSLPDGLFRVQVLEFDDMPVKGAEREGLIRWRIEKSAAFDTTGLILRHQTFRRDKAGFVVIACLARADMLAEYEDVLSGLGLEVWDIGISSFSVLNLYAPYIMQRTAVSAIAFVNPLSFTTIVIDRGIPSFYRYKEFKRSQEQAAVRLIREIDDSLHFYTHRDRSQPEAAGIERLYLVGEPAVTGPLSEGLASALSMEVEPLSPSILSQSGMLKASFDSSPVLSAALGAGGAL